MPNPNFSTDRNPQKGRKTAVPGSGRLRLEDRQRRLEAEAKARRMIEEATEKVVKKYLSFAVKNAATSRHAVDKLIPPQSAVEHSGPGGEPIEIQADVIQRILTKK